MTLPVGMNIWFSKVIHPKKNNPIKCIGIYWVASINSFEYKTIIITSLKVITNITNGNARRVKKRIASFIIITISVIGEIIIISNLSKKSLKYTPPIYGIVALVFDVIGLIILRGYIFWGYPSGDIMILLPFAIFAIIFGGAGLYKNDTEHAFLAIGGIFLGGALLLISLWPLLYYMLGFVAILYH